MSAELVPVGTWCFFHNVHEPDLPGDFMACFECGHVFRTPWDLLMIEFDMWEQWIARGYESRNYAARVVGEIHSCPLCCHDW